MGDKLGVVVASSVRVKRYISIAPGSESHEQSLLIPATPGEWFSHRLPVYLLDDRGSEFNWFTHRLVQFYIRIGSKSLGPTCTRPRSRNEGILCALTLILFYVSDFHITVNNKSSQLNCVLFLNHFLRCCHPVLHQQWCAVAVPKGAGL